MHLFTNIFSWTENFSVSKRGVPAEPTHLIVCRSQKCSVYLNLYFPFPSFCSELISIPGGYFICFSYLLSKSSALTSFRLHEILLNFFSRVSSHEVQVPQLWIKEDWFSLCSTAKFKMTHGRNAWLKENKLRPKNGDVNKLKLTEFELEIFSAWIFNSARAVTGTEICN